MLTFKPKNASSGVKVESRFRAILLKKIWNRFNLSDRNFISSLKNYYDVNGFLTSKQYSWLVKIYDKHIDNYTEFQSEE